MNAAIVTPTLDLEAAARVTERARQLAGLDCFVILVSDYARRGALRPTNAALAAALNLGVDYIIHLNDDATVTQAGWARRMVEALGENPRYGLAAASGPCRSKPQSDGYPGMPLGVVVADHPLANFCQVVKAQLYRDLGLHDTELIHYSDESDFSMRARAAGWLEIWVQDVWVDHRVSLPIQEWWEHDRAVFKRKWSK